MEPGDIEGTAAAIIRQCGDETDPPTVPEMVRRLVGRVEPARGLRGHGALAKVNGEWRIYLRPGLPIEAKVFALAHELAEWWLRTQEQCQDGEAEHAADYLAACLVTPRRAFVASLRSGLELSELAHRWTATETHVALREAEVTGRPRAVISPALVRVRGEGFVWPVEGEVRRWARRGGPGLRKVRLSDDPKRVVLDPEERVG